jgi:hypothetical protein
MIFRNLFIALAIGLLSHPARAADLPFAIPACKSDTDCDRDPAHLTQFVTDFYKWFFDSSKMEHIDWENKLNKPVYQAAFTRKFYNSLNKLLQNSDVNPISLSQDELYTWPSHIQSDLVYGGSSPVIILMLGTPEERDSMLVDLKAENGTWRIANIRGICPKNNCQGR